MWTAGTSSRAYIRNELPRPPIWRSRYLLTPFLPLLPRRPCCEHFLHYPRICWVSSFHSSLTDLSPFEVLLVTIWCGYSFFETNLLLRLHIFFTLFLPLSRIRWGRPFLGHVFRPANTFPPHPRYFSSYITVPPPSLPETLRNLEKISWGSSRGEARDNLFIKRGGHR